MKASLTTSHSGVDTLQALTKIRNRREDILDILKECGEDGVKALEKSTPKKTGLTAASWKYNIEKTSKGYRIFWYNTNLTKTGDPVAVLIQYGHSTYQGYYVKGTDYINPAMKPVFDSVLMKLKAVTD